jgi:hypothetical protein
VLRFLIGILLLLFSFCVSGQSIYLPVGARATSLGDASITLQDAWSGFNNTAGIAGLSNYQIAASAENRYGMEGINLVTLGVQAPIPTGNAFAGVYRFGDEFYNEQKASVGYATEIGIIKLGFRANYLQYVITDFGRRSTYSIDFGGIATILPQLVIGAQALNITQSSLDAANDQYVPTLLKLGLSYRPGNYFMLNAEIEKNLERKAVLKVGAEYTLADRFFLRAGIQDKSFSSFYGVGLRMFQFQLDYALSNHPELGISNSIALHYAFNKK